MSFEIDKQTLRDLQIIDSHSEGHSIIGLFNPKSIGGSMALQTIFSFPVSDTEKIEERFLCLWYIRYPIRSLNIRDFDLEYIEEYLKLLEPPIKPSTVNVSHNYLKFKLKPTRQYWTVDIGVNSVLLMLVKLRGFFQSLPGTLPSTIDRFKMTFSNFYAKVEDSGLNIDRDSLLLKKNLLLKSKYDHLFRYVLLDELKSLMEMVYQLDVLYATIDAMEKYNFSIPEIDSSESSNITITGLFHPFIANPVKNDVQFNRAKNIFLITGSNMSGKSTLLKSIGICVFLAHIGFPVPCTNMRFSVLKGLITTINLSDNIKLNTSHFYAEVLRVKMIAEKLKSGEMLVIFDELFKGTNPSDAQKCSVEVISALAEINSGFFIISTHLTDIVPYIDRYPNIVKKYLEIETIDNRLKFKFNLIDGVTDDKVGYLILKESKVIDSFQQLANRNVSDANMTG